MNNESVVTPAAPAPASAYKSNPLELIKPAFAAFKLSWVTLLLLGLAYLGAFLAVILLYAVLSFVGAAVVGNLLAFVLAIPVAFYGSMYLYWATTKCILAAVRGQKLTFKAALPPVWTDPLKLFLTQLIALVLTVLGFAFLIVPGIFALAFWSYAPFVTVDTGVWGWEALKQSRDVMRGRGWEVLGAVFLSSAIAVITFIGLPGILVYFIFTLLTFPLVYVRYDTMRELKSQPDWDKTPINKWNYIVFVIGLLVGGRQQVTSFQQLQKNAQPVVNIHQAY